MFKFHDNIERMEQELVQDIEDNLEDQGISPNPFIVKAVADKLLTKDLDGTESDWQEKITESIIELYGNRPNVITSLVECAHEWDLYQGLMNTFEYCRICDQKK